MNQILKDKTKTTKIQKKNEGKKLLKWIVFFEVVHSKSITKEKILLQW